MAVAGGATSAYWCWVDEDGKFCVEGTTTMRNLCDTPEQAVNGLRDGNTVTVAASDIIVVRRLFNGKGEFGGLEAKYVIVDDLPNMEADNDTE